MNTGSASSNVTVPATTPKKTFKDLHSVTIEIELKEKKLRDLALQKQSLGCDLSTKIKDAVVDLELKNVEVQKLSDDIRKLEGDRSQMQMNLTIRNEARIDESIRKLENQLQVRNFKLLDEKKIVAEINYLRKSKKLLQSYNLLNKSIDDKRIKIRSLRKDKDIVQNQIQRMRSDEDKFKRKTSIDAQMTCEIEDELKILFERKTSLEIQLDEGSRNCTSCDASPAVQSMPHHVSHPMQKCLTHVQPETVDVASRSKQNKSFAVSSLSLDIPTPFDLCKACRNLISYLEQLVPQSLNKHILASSAESLNANLREETEGVFVGRRRSREEQEKMLRRIKKEKRRSERRHLTIPAQIFEEFVKVDLAAPSYISDVQQTIEKLEEKLKLFTHMSIGRETSGNIQKSLNTVAPAENPSCQTDSESVLNDASVDTTPETTVSSDFSTRATSSCYQHKLSQDSGTCELDTAGSNLAHLPPLPSIRSYKNALLSSDSHHSSLPECKGAIQSTFQPPY